MEESHGLVELASGVDSIYLSSRPNVSEKLFRDLSFLSQNARELDQDSVPYQIGTEYFEVLNHRWQNYAVCIRHNHGLIGFTKSKSFPGVRVQIYSEFLHAVGAEEAIRWFTNILKLEGIAVEWTVSRIDLFMDIQGWDIANTNRDEFISKAKAFGIDGDDSVYTGYRFGRRTTGTVIARIYNKTEEIKVSGKDWMKLIWGSDWNSNEDVWRIEFEVHSQFFREVGLGSASLVLSKIDQIWITLTQSWLSHRIVGDDTNSSRWPLSAEWIFVQGCSFVHNFIPLKRIRQVKRVHHLDSIMAGLKGYVTSASAHSDAQSLPECMAFVEACLGEYDRGSRKTFVETLNKKRDWLKSL